MLLAALRRSQLRLAISIATIFAVVMALIPLIYAAVPVVRDAVLFDVPLLWWVLGFAVFPLLTTLGWIHVRATERYEQQFADLIRDV